MIELRRATDGDADAVACLHVAAFNATYDFPLAHTDEEVRRWIRDIVLPTQQVWVATAPDGSVVAVMALAADMVEQLYVAPGWTGQGIGSRLLALAKERRPDGLELWTFEVNAGARRFYEHHGFVEAERTDGGRNEERQPDVRYAWWPSEQRISLRTMRPSRPRCRAAHASATARPVTNGSFPPSTGRPALSRADGLADRPTKGRAAMTSPRTTGVWISANSATILRWDPELTVRHRIDSTVPGRHRSTGRPPTEEHPGGEGHRDEHMRAFFDHVARALAVDDDVLLVGDGEVVEHFADRIRADDANHRRERRIEIEKSGSITDRQLLARIRAFAGSSAKRQFPR